MRWADEQLRSTGQAVLGFMVESSDRPKLPKPQQHKAQQAERF
jgi:hypothetical protein